MKQKKTKMDRNVKHHNLQTLTFKPVKTSCCFLRFLALGQACLPGEGLRKRKAHQLASSPIQLLGKPAGYSDYKNSNRRSGVFSFAVGRQKWTKKKKIKKIICFSSFLTSVFTIVVYLRINPIAFQGFLQFGSNSRKNDLNILT